jgi:hypothetical protein
MDDKIGASLEECLYSRVEGGIDELEHASISSNEPALTSTPSKTENTEKGTVSWRHKNMQCHKTDLNKKII